MDAAPRTARKFPAYTLAELKSWVAAGTATNLDAVLAEIAAREAGATHYKVPQIEGGKVQPRIGRM